MAQEHEKKINEILLNQSENERLFKSRAGTAWQGEMIRKGNIIILKGAVPFYGMPDGWPDIIGWQTVTITPDMVGQEIAVFKAVEVKTGKQKVKASQQRFRDIILKMGGVHIIS